jgi:hypothetical protein
VSDPRDRASKRPTTRPSSLPTSVPPFDFETFAKVKMAKGGSRAQAAIAELAKRLKAGDFRGGLRIIESLVALEPDSSDVQADAERCREHVIELCEARLGGVTIVPTRKES